MKHLKMWGLAVAAMTASMVFAAASTASATELDCGAVMCAVGQEVHAEVEGPGEAEGGLIMHPPFGDLTCSKSTLKGKTKSTGSSSETVSVTLESLSFTECNSTMTVLRPGQMEFHTDASDSTGTSGNGTLTWSGFEVTQEFIGTHCIFSTSGTDIGTVTGSKTTGATATLDISAVIPRTGGRSGAFCGSTAQWTGSYKFDIPDSLNVT